MRKLLDTVKEILQKGNDKLIIVSQWAMLLEVIASHLSSIKGATYSKFTGSVAIKDRQVWIMDIDILFYFYYVLSCYTKINAYGFLSECNRIF